MSVTNTSVPLCDINAQYRDLQPEIDAAVLRVVSSGQAINGPDVLALEKEVAAYCGVSHAIGCSSGSDALLLALAAYDIGPGDEVIIPPFTFFATMGAVCRLGATPIFADVLPDQFNIDPEQIEAKITSRTRAIIPVHLYGQCANLDEIQAIAAKHGLVVIEDAAQSFGAEYQGKKCASFGEINCLSFYPSKNLGTLGDAGMVTTNDSALAKKLYALRNHGCEIKYYHKMMGWNARIDTLQAAILRVKLPYVNSWIAKRAEVAARYDQLLTDAQLLDFVTPPKRETDRSHSFNQYVVKVADGDRDRLVQHFRSHQVGCEIYYPMPLHLQECIRHLGYRVGNYPVSEKLSNEVMALPMFPEITLEQQRRVVEVCLSFVANPVRRAA